MRILDKLERRIGKYAIKGLMRYVIACYIIGYIIYYIHPSFLSWLTLEPYLIFHNAQIWRLVSWVLMPPNNTNIIFVVIMLVLYYQLGTTLEQSWGSFRFNVYFFGGIIFTIIGALVVYLIYGPSVPISIGWNFSTFYINMSIFLTFATAFPDMRVMLYFFIPIKMKWMALVYAILMVYEFVVAGTLAGRVAIVASLVNFLIYFLATRNLKRFTPHEVKRRNNFKRQVNDGKTQNAKYRSAGPRNGSSGQSGSRNAGFGPSGSRNTGFGPSGSRNTSQRNVDAQYAPPNKGKTAFHKCAICGRTELDDPNLTFRYCSKCNGNYEYCQDHLFTHKHIQ